VPRLTARGVAFLLAGAGILALAYAVERPELLIVGALAVVAPLIALVVVASARPAVRVARQLEPVVAVQGEVVRVTVSVSGRARAAEWLERVPMRPGFAGPGRLPDVRLTRPATFGYRYWPGRRGLVPVGPLLIEGRDPFALAVRVTDTRAVSTQLVLPPVVPLPPGPIPEPSTESGARSARSRERSDDDVVTREYRQGDALRRVHWRVTARQGELMVRQDEPQAGPRSRLVIDTQVGGYRDADGRRDPASVTFEQGVRLAASVAVHLAERGYSVDLLTPTPRTADAPHGDGPAGAVLGELALLGLGPNDAHREPSSRAGSLPVVVIASDPDPETVRWMLAHRSPPAPALALLLGDGARDATGGGEPGASATPETAEAAFARAGWSVARVPASASPEQAWLTLSGVDAQLLPEWAVPRD